MTVEKYVVCQPLSRLAKEFNELSESGHRLTKRTMENVLDSLELDAKEHLGENIIGIEVTSGGPMEDVTPLVNKIRDRLQQ